MGMSTYYRIRALVLQLLLKWHVFTSPTWQYILIWLHKSVNVNLDCKFIHMKCGLYS